LTSRRCCASALVYSTRSKVSECLAEHKTRARAHLSSAHYTMPPQRAFGAEISGNARKKSHLTPSERTRIIAKHEAGASLAELAFEFKRSKSTIHDTIKRYLLHQTKSDLPRSGWPPRLLSRTKKIIYGKARAAPKIEYSELAKEEVVVNADRTTTKPPSHSTLYRALKRKDLTNFHCKRDLNLTTGMLQSV
jgi:transposase